MKRSGQILMTMVLMLGISSAAFGGTITGSRTSRTGTITGSRTGTITGSKTGTITGSRRGVNLGRGSGVAQERDERKSFDDDLIAYTLLFLLNLYFR
jgi:hypothetical protein